MELGGTDVGGGGDEVTVLVAAVLVGDVPEGASDRDEGEEGVVV